MYDYLVSTNKRVGGKEYLRLQDALERLRGTSIKTNIMTGGERVKEGFGIVDSWKIIEKAPDDDRMIGVEVTISKWLFNAVQAREVLTIVEFSRPAGATDYVNSLWRLQDDPFGGDVVNSYNDGPATPGGKGFGDFYELESSSPALALAPGAAATHVHRTLHLTGPRPALAKIALAVLGADLDALPVP